MVLASSLKDSLRMDKKQLRLWNKIQELDLGPIRFKLVNCDEGGEPWPAEKVRAVEPGYRQFLFLTAVEDDSISIVPSVDIDQFWHTHILDTSKYAADCETIFGHFLHHFPYLGMRGEDDKLKLHDSFAETGDLFKKYFDTAPAGYPQSVDASEQPREAAYCGDTGSCGGCDKRGDTSRQRPRLDLQVAA